MYRKSGNSKHKASFLEGKQNKTVFHCSHFSNALYTCPALLSCLCSPSGHEGWTLAGWGQGFFWVRLEDKRWRRREAPGGCRLGAGHCYYCNVGHKFIAMRAGVPRDQGCCLNRLLLRTRVPLSAPYSHPQPIWPGIQKLWMF